MVSYRSKSAGSWKVSLAIPATLTTLTRRRERFKRRDEEGTSNGCFFWLYLIPRFFVDITFLTKTTTIIIPPLPHTHVTSASSSVLPSPFAVPSRVSTSKPREKTARTAMINTADKGNHASLGREDENEADPAPSSDVEMCTVGHDRDRDQGQIEVCLSPTFTVYVHTYAA